MTLFTKLMKINLAKLEILGKKYIFFSVCYYYFLLVFSFSYFLAFSYWEDERIKEKLAKKVITVEKTIKRKQGFPLLQPIKC